MTSVAAENGAVRGGSSCRFDCFGGAITLDFAFFGAFAGLVALAPSHRCELAEVVVGGEMGVVMTDTDVRIAVVSELMVR